MRLNKFSTIARFNLVDGTKNILLEEGSHIDLLEYTSDGEYLVFWMASSLNALLIAKDSVITLPYNNKDLWRNGDAYLY